MEADLPVYITFGYPPVSLDGLYEINKHLADFLSLFEELLYGQLAEIDDI